MIFLSALAMGASLLCMYLNKREKEELAEDNGDKSLKLSPKATFYERVVKRAIDVTVAFFGLIISAPIALIASLFIVIEDPGNPIFRQKRVGINKSYFNIHKLRSMKKNTGDIPTHLLSKEAQDNLILKTGKFIRKYSVDEIPQFIDILRNKMSLVGPRPALWNQYDLIAERDRYGANDVMPGLTGWAQINGRDELEIPVKAKLDGEYVKALRKSSLSGFMMDLKCVIGTVSSVLSSKGVVEGGTGSRKGRISDDEDLDEEFRDRDSVYGFGGEEVRPDFKAHKKVLITGKDSYIGTSFEAYAKAHYPGNFDIDTIDMIGDGWKNADFSGYDIVYHVAGIAHADIGSATEETKKLYYSVNTDLAVETAKKAKAEGVKEFIFMSSSIVYGDSKPYGGGGRIDEETEPAPANFYGDSKYRADRALRNLADGQFKVIVLRPPMIYGKGSKGNFKMLEELAGYLPVFPNALNRRSMLYIGNLCEFLCGIMLVGEDEYSSRGNIFFPQNKEYSWTYDIVNRIKRAQGRGDMMPTRIFNPLIPLISGIPGKIGGMAVKAFGNFYYDSKMSVYPGIDYQIYDLDSSIKETVIEESTRDKDCEKEGQTAAGNAGTEGAACTSHPLVTVVTVTYNSADTIEKTILSVLHQKYDRIDYRIIDGASEDDTVSIAESYAKEFAARGYGFTIVSERDKGIYDAMNKGIKAAEGELIGFINSGDRYLPDAVSTAVNAYEKTGYEYFFADIKLVRPNGSYVIKHSKKDVIATSRHWNHPSSFATKKLYDELGGFKCKGIHDDFEFYLRCRRNMRKIVIQNKVIAEFTTGGASNEKSLSKALRRIADRYECYTDNDFSPLYIAECVAIEAAKAIMI